MWPDRRLKQSKSRSALAGLVALCLLIAGLIQFGPGASRTSHAQSTEVDLVLMLAIDVSYSVDSREFALQMQGMAEAFRRPDVQRAIKSGQLGRIAIAVMQWADDENQLIGVPWTVIDSEASALKFADVLSREPRRVAEGGTSIGAALRYAGAAVLSAPYQTKRRVIDLSADGRNNRGVLPKFVRDELVAQGITINGLAILNEWPTLDKYFEREIVGGPFHFVMVANDYEAYGRAIYRKLLREIVGPGIS